VKKSNTVPLPTTLDMDLLRSFVTIAETNSFTRAADRLYRTQSTVSLQIKRLEEQLRCPLFDRTSRSVRLTPQGEILLDYARQLLRLNDELVARMLEPDLDGKVRLGTPEDFATAHLPGVLADFARAHPRVALEVTCDLTLNLHERFRGGEFDLALVKREPQAAVEGVAVWREPLVWATANPSLLDTAGPLPLIVSPNPCVYRKRATSALDEQQRLWRIAYTSPSLAGTQAAVLAGLGVTVLPRAMVRAGMTVLGESSGLPQLADTEIALLRAHGLSRSAERLGEHIVHALEQAGPET
jgi:DNA-binding transcriptional LysR family regulator